MATIVPDPLERKTQMQREDLMNPDLLSEIVLLGSAALMVVALLLIVVAALRQGEMWVDRKQERLAAFNGHLTQDVKFGLGLLGHLDKGGHFEVSQAEVVPGHWDRRP
jgi:hypothetical protein